MIFTLFIVRHYRNEINICVSISCQCVSHFPFDTLDLTPEPIMSVETFMYITNVYLQYQV